jgi:hypothetical protein
MFKLLKSIDPALNSAYFGLPLRLALLNLYHRLVHRSPLSSSLHSNNAAYKGVGQFLFTDINLLSLRQCQQSHQHAACVHDETAAMHDNVREAMTTTKKGCTDDERAGVVRSHFLFIFILDTDY